MLKLMSHRRRLLRKNMYRAPHRRHSENIILERGYPKNYNRSIEDSSIKSKKKTKRVNKGYKMSYRYKYYNNPHIDEDKKTEESDEIDS